LGNPQIIVAIITPAGPIPEYFARKYERGILIKAAKSAIILPFILPVAK
jgi:hypothetical protein